MGVGFAPRCMVRRDIALLEFVGGLLCGSIGVRRRLVDRVGASCGAGQQPGQANQVVGGHGEGDLPVDLGQPSVARLAQTGDDLSPAERFLDALADAQADRVSGVARGAAFDRGAPAIVVPCDVRGDVDLTHLGDEVLHVDALVAAERDALRAARVRFRSDAVRPIVPHAPRRGVATAPTISPLRFTISAWPMKQSLAYLPSPLLIEPGVRIGGRGVRVVAALLAVEVLPAIAAWIGRRAGAVFGAENSWCSPTPPAASRRPKNARPTAAASPAAAPAQQRGAGSQSHPPEGGSRLLVKVVASQTGSSTPRPTNQRNSRSNSIRSPNWRSERIV